MTACLIVHQRAGLEMTTNEIGEVLVSDVAVKWIAIIVIVGMVCSTVYWSVKAVTEAQHVEEVRSR